MKTDEILNMDYRKKENKIKIQKVLRKIKPLSKYSEDEDIPLVILEKLIAKYQKKYDVKFSYIMISTADADEVIIYSASLRNSEGKWLKNIYGAFIYELFAKVNIFIYSEVKKGKIERKEK